MVEICKKYVWDSGEHNLQTDIYSYEIIDPYFEGCKRYEVWANYEYFVNNPWLENRCSARWYTLQERRQIVPGNYWQQVNADRGFNPTVTFDPGSSFSSCSGWGAKTARFLVRERNSQCHIIFTYYQEFVTGIDGIYLIDKGIEYIEVGTGQPPPIKLKILDGGIESIYSINNKNSVQLIEYECGCPPNQLDCGDCCLDCNNIFNQISGIRALIRSLN